MSSILSREDIRRLLDTEPPLIASYCSLEQQLQPNGFDLTLRQIALSQSLGRIGVDNSQRLTAALAPLVFDSLGFINLVPGAYIITFNEVVNLPEDVMALAWPRSSLLRCGVTVHTAVWDAGYSGRSQSLMVIYNPQGFRVQRNARVVQLVFTVLTQKTASYQGSYQGENI